jgi:hypothetical protein
VTYYACSIRAQFHNGLNDAPVCYCTKAVDVPMGQTRLQHTVEVIDLCVLQTRQCHSLCHTNLQGVHHQVHWDLQAGNSTHCIAC